MSEEKKDVNIDEEVNKLLENSSITTEEDKNFIKNIGESLKKGEPPIDLIFGKSKEAISKLDELKKTNPEFESFVTHYKNKINESVNQMMKLAKDMSHGN